MRTSTARLRRPSYLWRVIDLGIDGLHSEQVTPAAGSTAGVAVPARDVEQAVWEARVLEPLNDPALLVLDLQLALAASPVVYAVCAPLAPGTHRADLVVTDSLGAVSTNTASVTFYVGSGGTPVSALQSTATARSHVVNLAAPLAFAAIFFVAVVAAVMYRTLIRVAVRWCRSRPWAHHQDGGNTLAGVDDARSGTGDRTRPCRAL
jgi:hypothetical protein